MLVAVGLAAGACGARADETVVTLNFDDGLASQYAHRDILGRHGVKATFLINSAKVGSPGQMTWDQVAQLAADGHEIGGHTLSHPHLTTLSAAEQQDEICDDRAALAAHGHVPRSFAYPFGDWNATTQAIVADCGYETARTTGGTDYPEGPVFAETFPPGDAYALRAYQLHLDTSLATWQDIVEKARASGGGWVHIVLHDICVPGPDCDAAGAFAVRTDTLEQAIEWLQTLPDVKVRTAAHALDVGTDTTAPAVALTTPADGATVVGQVAVSADASDAVGVARVDFLVDGVPVGSDTSAPFAVAWDASGLRGPATITATAVDEAGNLGTSAARTVLPDTTPPVVTPPRAVLVGPKQARDRARPHIRIVALKRSGRRVTLRVVARDASGIRAVRLLLRGRLVARDRHAPFVLRLRLRPGRHALVVEAVDRAGNRARTAVRGISVPRPHGARSRG